jgi:hypothetical protein
MQKRGVSMSEQSDREAIFREIAKKKIRYVLPNMEAVEVRRDLPYRDNLLMNIYCPAPRPGRRAPIVVMAFGYPDPLAGVRTFGPMTSWSQLIAASGMAAVIYGPNVPAEDIDAALAYVRANAEQFDLDADRVALFAMSGNVPVALSLLMRGQGISCAALHCGYTMDLDGATAVADAAAQYGFADACHGKSVDDLPSDIPLLVVRAGRDKAPGLNHALDAVVTRGLARNLPLTLINHATGEHGFECDEDSDISREIVADVLAFLRAKLGVGR